MQWGCAWVQQTRTDGDLLCLARRLHDKRMGCEKKKKKEESDTSQMSKAGEKEGYTNAQVQTCSGWCVLQPQQV